MKKTVAISFAQQDLPVAEAIALSLQKAEISYYLYTEQRAANWGEDIFKISLEKYSVEASFVLMLISGSFAQGKWSDIERQIAQLGNKNKGAYILPLRIDDSPVDGLSSNIAFEVWNNNPDEIAALIKEKLRLTEGDEKIKTGNKKQGNGDMITNQLIVDTINNLNITNH